MYADKWLEDHLRFWVKATFALGFYYLFAYIWNALGWSDPIPMEFTYWQAILWIALVESYRSQEGY